MGLTIKFPRAIALKLASYVNLVLLCIFCNCIGFLGGLFYSISKTAEQMKTSVINLEAATNKLVNSQEENREWRKYVDDRFTEQQGKMRRLEHLMRVPRSERNKAALNYKYYNYGHEEAK